MLSVNKHDVNTNTENRVELIGSALMKNSFSYDSGNTGNGTITGVNAILHTVTEDWTLTCTSTATDGGTFSVYGSVSGDKPDATVGTAYDIGIIKFTINDGSTDWDTGDKIYISIVREVKEVVTDKPMNTIQVDCTGDMTSATISIEGSLNGDNYYKTYTTTLSLEELTSGKLDNLNDMLVSSSSLKFDEVFAVSDGTLKVYAK